MNYTEDDKIGREEIVNKISSLVDNLQQDKYFVLLSMASGEAARPM